MKKLTLALCFALVSALVSASGPVEEIKATAGKNLVAFTGNRTQSISPVKSDILDTFFNIYLKEVAGINIVPQITMESLSLPFEEENLESIGKAMEKLNADREICYFVSDNSFGYKIDFMVFDGRTGDTLYNQSGTAGDMVECIAMLSVYLKDAESILVASPKKIVAAAEAKPGTSYPAAKPARKSYNAPSAPDRLNFEFGVYDFLNRGCGPLVRNHSSFLALNYKISTPMKDLVFIFGPFYSEGLGSNDVGMRVAGYFNRFPKEFYNVYTGISASGGYCNRDKNLYAETEVKLGGELLIFDVDLFGEGGVAFRTGQALNILVNMGVRLYIF